MIERGAASSCKVSSLAGKSGRAVRRHLLGDESGLIGLTSALQLELDGTGSALRRRLPRLRRRGGHVG